jgi:type VI secretion system protein ImpG
VLALYELLLNHVTAITVSDPDGRAAPAVLGPEHIVPVGFEPGEGMLPYPARSLPGYRLLSEYFAFPEKFLFVEIEGLRERLAGAGRRVEICVHLDRAATALEKAVTPDTFRLGCTPVVNLFRQRAEPIRLSHEQAEYHVVPDARRTHATEIYSIERVTATLPDGTAVEHLPFYSVHHGGRRAEGRAWWLAARGGPRRASGEVGRGREVYLSLVDLEHSPALTAGAVIDVETICLNRDLPARLPFGAGRPRLQMTEGGVVARVECLRPPTPTRRPSSRDSAAWRLVSHLSLNHLSITGEDGAAALREILRLYDAVDSQDTRSRAAGLLAVRTRRVTARVGRGAAAGFCRGMEVTLELDEEAFPDNGMFLFACVLERFLGLYCSINSFVAAVATTNQRGQIRRWPPRAGETVVI